jgi:hypothetical protein
MKMKKYFHLCSEDLNVGLDGEKNNGRRNSR